MSVPEGKNDIYIRGVPIPPQILAEILIRVNNSRDIGYVCPLVCHRWYNVLSASGFWISYMIYRSMDLPPSFLRSEPSLNVKKISLKQAFRRNLISNPSGEDGSLRGWELSEYGDIYKLTLNLHGDDSDEARFQVERPPVGCINALEDIPVAFATSFGWCSKFQIIDLWKEGIERAFLDEFCPPVTISEYYTCRFDCASIYLLEVQLLPDGSLPLEFRPMPGTLLGPQCRRLEEERDVPQHDETTNTSITRVRMLRDNEWEKIEHTFSNYPRGIRYILFQHGGKDQQFWAGHYGSKMAKASVTINYGNGKRRLIP
uniref:FBA domain-containing protein n=1 Tax=Elaeophora elaphi TaxID=1147741 RepID=A0A0R3RTK6_9BILA